MSVSTRRSPAPETVGRIPDFLIVGHPKCGTTALYEMLRRRPEIYMPENKEPWFFARELHEHTPPRPDGTPRTLAEYMAWFTAAGPEQIVGEASPHYLWSATAAEHIARVNPDARIIAIFREPASFLRSLHLQFLEVYYETEADLRRALELEEDRRAGRNVPRYTYWPQLLLYSEHIRYVEQLRRYHAVFPPEQVKVLIYEDFRADNVGTMREVLGFLGVDAEGPIEAVRANPTVRPRSQLLNELVHAVGVGRGPFSRMVKESIKAVTPKGPRQAAFTAVRRRLVFGAPEPPDEELMAELRWRFRGETKALGEYLGRDLLASWGGEQP
ncbi:MAG TPA: sulfotransferase [Solirubrobacteraceae bacterium]|nr:sulfotransferase [Solirubrobacteraceae bacterium]